MGTCAESSIAKLRISSSASVACLKIVALIELDDSTHVASADRQRDAMTKVAGFQVGSFSIETEAK